jgi:S-DNA-T family DNA segregation ATPase FtsK/SpoIIIE
MAGDGRVVQIAHPGELAAAVATIRRAPEQRSTRAARAPRLPELPRLVPLDGLVTPVRERVGDTWALPLGVDADHHEPVVLDVHPGDHLLIAGPARSGRSEALRLVARAARRAGGGALAWCPRGGPLAADPHVVVITGRDDLTARLDARATSAGPTVVLIDDGELVDDPTGLVSTIVAGTGPHAGVVVVAAGRVDALRAAYGHWTQPLRRRRLGLLLRPDGDADGDLFGVLPPRTPHLPPAPGRGVLVAAGEVRPLQLALADLPERARPPAAVTPRAGGRSPRRPARARQR